MAYRDHIPEPRQRDDEIERLARRAAAKAKRAEYDRAHYAARKVDQSSGEKFFTFDDLNAVLRVDDGVLVWRVSRGCVRAGEKAGSLDRDGYVVLRFKKRFLVGHRVIWLLTHGRWPVGLLDHADTDKANNRPSNLREATRSQNMQNSKPQVNKRFKGITRSTSGKYIAQCEGYIGSYDTPEQAAHAYDRVAAQRFGEFARLNFGSHP